MQFCFGWSVYDRGTECNRRALKKKLVVTRRLTARQRLRRQQVNGKTKGRAGVVDGQIRGGTGKAGRPDLSVHLAIHVLAALRCRGTCRQHHRGSSGGAL